jgi:hypothetical protein
MPTHQDLISDSERYRLVLVLHHKDIIDFVRFYYRSKGPWVLFFRRFLMLITILFLSHFSYILLQHIEKWDIYLLRFGLGVLGFFAIVPIHELIHGAVYKWFGAPKVRFGVLWSKLAFFAIAPIFVLSRREFMPLALAPFIVINSLLMLCLGLFINHFEISMLLWGALLMHSMGCVGDFALIGFFEQHKGKKIYTFDAETGGSSYFYEEVSA